MKLTKSKLKQIIKEELEAVLSEEDLEEKKKKKKKKDDNWIQDAEKPAISSEVSLVLLEANAIT